MTKEIRRLEIRTSESGVAAFLGHSVRRIIYAYARIIRHRRPTGHETVFEFDPVGYFGVTRPMKEKAPKNARQRRVFTCYGGNHARMFFSWAQRFLLLSILA